MIPTLLTDTVTTDLGRAFELTLLWGLRGVELRTVGSADERVPHINERALRERLMVDDLPVVAVAPSMFEGLVDDKAVWLNELAGFSETLRLCGRIGCPTVVTSAFASGEAPSSDGVVGALHQAGEAASDAGIRLAVLNERGMLHQTGEELAALLDAVDHPAVRAAWSPADALQAGESPHEGLAAIGERVELVRCSDGVVRGEDWEDTTLGEGEIGWPDHLRQLSEQGFDGPISLEVYVDPRRTMGLRMATRLVEWLQTI